MKLWPSRAQAKPSLLHSSPLLVKTWKSLPHHQFLGSWFVGNTDNQQLFHEGGKLMPNAREEVEIVVEFSDSSFSYINIDPHLAICL